MSSRGPSFCIANTLQRMNVHSDGVVQLNAGFELRLLFRRSQAKERKGNDEGADASCWKSPVRWFDLRRMLPRLAAGVVRIPVKNRSQYTAALNLDSGIALNRWHAQRLETTSI